MPVLTSQCVLSKPHHTCLTLQVLLLNAKAWGTQARTQPHGVSGMLQARWATLLASGVLLACSSGRTVNGHGYLVVSAASLGSAWCAGTSSTPVAPASHSQVS